MFAKTLEELIKALFQFDNLDDYKIWISCDDSKAYYICGKWCEEKVRNHWDDSVIDFIFSAEKKEINITVKTN